MSKDVYVLAEQRDGNIQKVSIELIGKATELAADLGQNVVAVLLGSNIKDKADVLIKHGADKVIVVDDPILAEYVTEPYAKALYEVIKASDPEIVLYGATSIGRDLAPRVSARVHTGLTADCTKLDIGTIDTMPDTKLLLMTRPAFGGIYVYLFVCKDHRPQMATVRPGVMKALARDDARTGEIVDFKVDFTPADMNVTIKESLKRTRRKLISQRLRFLYQADVVSELPSSLENSRNLPMYLAEKFLHQEQTLTQDGSRRIVRLDRQVRQYVLTSMLPAVFQELFSTLPVWKAQSI